MQVFVYSANDYDREFLDRANHAGDRAHRLLYHQVQLDRHTAELASGCEAACLFVNDRADRAALDRLAASGIRFLILRSAGFNHADLSAARELSIAVGRVPAYSPNAVAEHGVALMLALNRKTHRAYARVREGNFTLDGLLGFDMAGRTVGIVGTGRIGIAMARILHGFGCDLIGSDPVESQDFTDLGGRYLPVAELLSGSDIVTLHCPLSPETHHLIDHAAIDRMRDGVMLINTCRGAVIDTKAAIDGLKKGKIGSLGIDVYEEEGELFFHDRSLEIIQDDVFARLLTFPNTIVTSHQGFFTREAMEEIAKATIGNLDACEKTGAPLYPVDE